MCCGSSHVQGLSIPKTLSCHCSILGVNPVRCNCKHLGCDHNQLSQASQDLICNLTDLKHKLKTEQNRVNEKQSKANPEKQSNEQKTEYDQKLKQLLENRS